MSVSSGFYDTKAVIKDSEGQAIESNDTLKMLGYTFSSSPTIQAQLDYLIKKANKRTFLLLHYKRSVVPKERLKDVYCAMNRSILEYTSNVYHSLINIGQSNELELIQKRNLRTIYGYNHDYHTLLQISGLTSLKDRRIESFRKFAHKTVKNAKYSHWFPKNPSERDAIKDL